MVRRLLAGGLVAAGRWTQMLPSHSHVSERGPGPGVIPPKRTTRPRCESYAIPWTELAAGIATARVWIKLLTSHSQVSEK